MPSPSPHNTYAKSPQGAEPAADPTFGMDDLGDFFETQARGQFGDEIPVGGSEDPFEEETREASREAQPERPEAPERQPPDEDLRKSLEEQRREIEALRQSMSQPSGGIDPNALTQSFVQALHWQRQMERQSEPQRPPEPPSFFDASLDPLMDEPEKLRAAIDASNKKAAQWAYQQAQRDLGNAYGGTQQRISGIENFFGQLAPVFEDLARSRAEDFAQSAGLFADEKHREDLLSRAGQLLAGQQDPTMRYKPEGWKAAIQYLSSNDPALVREKAKGPPSAGDGDANPTVPGTPSRGRDLSNHPAARLAAQLAGRKPTADELEKFQGAFR